jgi:hypothetical protein
MFKVEGLFNFSNFSISKVQNFNFTTFSNFTFQFFHMFKVEDLSTFLILLSLKGIGYDSGGAFTHRTLPS